MGKFVYAVLAVFTVELALWLFGGATYSNTSLFGLMLNPSTIVSNPLYIAIIVAVAVFGLSAIIPGNIYQVNIYFLYAGLAAILITFSMSIVHLWQFMYGELNAISPTFALPITMIIIAPFLIGYIFATAEWVRSNN